MTEIHQFLPTFASRDAIGMHTLRLRRVLRDAGFASEIYADDIHEEVRGEARPYLEYESRPRSGERWMLYHASTGSPMADWLCRQDDPLMVDYHNITEARFFDRWAPLAADSMRHARVQLRQLAPLTEYAWAHSRFSEAELIDVGYRTTGVAPLLVDWSEYDVAPNERTNARLQQAKANGGADWLFVGRLAPNKCQHHVVGAFAAYRKIFDPNARLTFVGGVTAPLYGRALHTLVRQLELDDAVTFADSITFPEVIAYYSNADVFVCLSEHEGFNVPVVEAMRFSLPVVAYAGAAVPETVGDAGLVLAEKDPAFVAEAVHRVLTDRPTRTALINAGHKRLEHFSLTNASRLTLAAINAFLDQRRGANAS